MVDRSGVSSNSRMTRWSTRRWLAFGTGFGVACYLMLLGYHLAKFRGIHYCVPNVAGWAGRYPGFGWTWELTAINLPADIASRMVLLHRWVRPQAIAFYIDMYRTPKAWSATTWVISGVFTYAAAGLALGGLVAAGIMLRQRLRRPSDRINP